MIASGSSAAGQPLSGSASCSNHTPLANSSPRPNPLANSYASLQPVFDNPTSKAALPIERALDARFSPSFNPSNHSLRIWSPSPKDLLSFLEISASQACSCTALSLSLNPNCFWSLSSINAPSLDRAPSDHANARPCSKGVGAID